jgi:tol-pal system protein YbgF
MQKARSTPARIALAAVLAAALWPAPAQAASKEIVELQTQVQQLIDMVQRLQSTVDARFGAMQRLVEQTADNANAMSQAVQAMQQKINAQADSTSGKLDTTSGQIQSLNDSVDELKTRIAKLDKSIQDMQAQLQNIQNPPQQNPGGSAPGAPAPGGAGYTVSPPQGGGQFGAAPQQPAANQAPPLKDTFQAAIRDYNSAKYDVATGELQDVLRYYPDDDLAGTAQFYLGEIAYRQGNYSDAVKDYNAVLEQYSGNPKAPAAQLRKGLALLQLNKRDAAIHEFRALIQRHPQTPEAAQARSKLNGMGVRIVANR